MNGTGLTILWAVHSLAAVLEPAWTTTTQPPNGHFTARVIGQEYCGATPNDITASLFLTIEVQLRNEGTRPIIVAREPGPPMVSRVARSLEDAARGIFAAELAWEEAYTESEANRIPRVRLGSAPDPSQFVVLSHGGTYKWKVTTAVVVARQGTGPIPGTVPAGSEYLLQVEVPLWPFRLTPPDEMRDPSTRWLTHGELFVGSDTTEFLAFRADVFATLPACESRPGKS